MAKNKKSNDLSSGKPLSFSNKKDKKSKKNQAMSAGVNPGANTRPKPYSKKPRPLDPLREQLAVMVDEANRRVETLATSGIQSRAIYEAMRTQLPSHRERYENLFNSNLPRTRDIKREYARVQAFLSDYTSISGGADAFDSTLAGVNPFGGQYHKLYGKGYDPNIVSADDASAVFEIYRRVLEHGGGWDRVIGHLRAVNAGATIYDSEKIINAIYDMVQNTPQMYDPELTDEQSYNDYIEQITSKAWASVESMIQMYDEMAERQRSGINYGLLGEKSVIADRYDRWKWEEYRKNLRR